ncbi:MAG: hypothetical protein LUF68_09060, partial [Clostridiales bacterium]|nr:hypothetical protein [Clostridiales bacterium]
MKNLRRPLSLIVALAVLCSLGGAALADEEMLFIDEEEIVQAGEIQEETDVSAGKSSDDAATAEEDNMEETEEETTGTDDTSEMDDAVTAAETDEMDDAESTADIGESSETETNAVVLEEEEPDETEGDTAEAEEAVEVPSDELSDEVQMETAALAAGDYDVTGYVQLSLSALGADFASGLVSGAELTVDEDGTASLTLKLQVSQTLTLNDESCYAYIDASTSAPGYYDTAGNRHSATYTTTNKLENASLHTATDTDGNE